MSGTAGRDNRDLALALRAGQARGLSGRNFFIRQFESALAIFARNFHKTDSTPSCENPQFRSASPGNSVN
jgi:hypothetical protein